MGVAHDAHDPASQPRDGGEVEDDPVVADGDQVHQVVTQLADMGALDQRLIDQPHHGDAAPVRDLESRPSPAGADLAALARPTSRFLVRPPQSGQVADDLLPPVGGLGLGREIDVAGDPVLEPPIERAPLSVHHERDIRVRSFNPAQQGNLTLNIHHGSELPPQSLRRTERRRRNPDSVRTTIRPG